jgi:uncharacterized protein YjdB
MTVKELIEILKWYEEDSRVYVYNIETSNFTEIKETGVTENSKYKKLFITAE